MHREKSKNLLDLLMQEFRLWRSLVCLARAERLALLACDAAYLIDLSRDKQSLLNGLQARQQARRELMHAFASLHLSSSLIGTPVSLQDLLENFTSQEANCLLHLTEGILSLAVQVGDLSLGNCSLADCAARRLLALQDWAQQESERSLPALLASVLAGQDVLDTEEIPTSSLASVPWPATSRPLDSFDQDLYAIWVPARDCVSG